MLASGWNGTLYVGVTSDLIKRVWQHKSDWVDGFTRQYRVHDLVWFEQHWTVESALAREKAIKEGGDVLWYFFVWLDMMGVTLREVIQANMDKLTEDPR